MHGDLHRAFLGNSSISRPEAVNSKLASQVARRGLHKLAKPRTPQEAINLGAAFDARISYAAETGYLIISIEHWLWKPDLIQHWQSYSYFLGQLQNHSRTEDKTYKGMHINSANIALNSHPHAPRSHIKGAAIIPRFSFTLNTSACYCQQGLCCNITIIQSCWQF